MECMIKKDLQIPPSLYLAVTLAFFTDVCLLFKLLILCWHLETHICTGTVMAAPPAAEHFIVCGQLHSREGILTSTQGHAHAQQIPPTLVCKSTLRPN